jgi:hypothetical protein
MTNVDSESSLVLQRLRAESAEYDRPEIRLATIDRLVAACDAIETGKATEVIRHSSGRAYDRRHLLAISPTNIERYAKARKNSGDQHWTGPTRTFISADRSLNAYVRARESERVKPAMPRRPTERYKELEDAIESIRDIEKRQLLRHELEKGRAVQRQLGILKAGLRTIPALDLESLLNPSTRSPNGTTSQISSSLTKNSDLNGEERELLRHLLARLLDADEMRRAGLELHGKRLRMAVVPRTTIVRPVEMELLQRLALWPGAKSVGSVDCRESQPC